MSHLSAVRGIYRDWSKGHFFTALELFDPELVYVVSPEFPDSGTYAGLEQVAEFLRSWLDPWERIAVEAEELTDAGERVLAAVRQEGVGRGSGVPGEMRYFQIWTFRGGKVIRLDAIRDREDAFHAAGLPV